ncbi:LysR family transcriptional regulator [Mogibacterium neglectum]|uniref:LysR family transcriptional regulator n=1 Tax=Mogibacterium neglectum TaxID=114528 RepID=UPI00272D9F46|nr:LysR family transcriptional regulator [Mogibacterium neglectum]WLD76191.1 LysR family transcriptional regulator [Mogibacterium neglectum]
MTLNQLRYFLAVAEHENYRKAAEKLYISQPSLSRSISSLETELGVLLFDKNGRGIELTKEGRIFLIYAERIIRECDVALNRMQEIAKGGGQIDIGYVYPLANHYIPNLVRSFLAQEDNENISFNFYQGHTPAIVSKLKIGELDVGFGGHIPNDEDLDFYPIIKEELVIITPKGHPLDAQDFVSINELNNHPFISYERGAWMGKYTAHLCEKLSLSPNVVFECPDEHSIHAMVSEGFGIALVPHIDELDEEKITIHSVKDADLYHHTYMICMKDHFLMPAAKHFKEYVKSFCSKEKEGE